MTEEEKQSRNRERSRLWRIAHPDYMKAYMRKYLATEHGQKTMSASQKCYRNRILPGLLVDAKRRAKKRGIEFKITEKDVYLPKVCPIYGIELKQGHSGHAEDCSPTLDRIDNTKGYVPGNVQVISHRANSHKNSATLAEILLLAKWAKKNMQGD